MAKAAVEHQDANPTVIWPAPGSDGAMGDDHSPGTIVKPHAEASFTATQHYRYRCPCKNGNSPVVLMGPIAITREVKRRPDGKFKYIITKSGKSASIDPLR